MAKDEKVLTMTPAYGFFLHACEYNGVELVKSPLKKSEGRFEIDFEDFAQKAADPKVRLLMLCNPHNPSGRISDEIHCDLIRTGLSHIPMGKIMPDYKKLITTISASKTFNLAGMLFSNIIIRDEEERNRFKDRDKNIGAANPLSVAAHKAAYEHGGRWLSELKEYIDESFKMVDRFLKENIPQARFTVPEATYFAWVDMSRVLPDVEDLPLFFANNSGVLLEGGDGLFVDNAKGYIRLNLAMPRATIEEGLRRMAEAIKKHNR